MKKIRWGILGCGRIAETFTRSMEYCEGGEILSGASRTPGKAEKFCQKFGIPNAFEDYGELLKDDRIDAIYVGTTHNFHHENVMMAIEAGKHVLCEKPLAVNAVQAREMVQAARSAGTFLMEAIWTRFLPAVTKMGSLLEEGAIGEPRFISASFGIPIRPSEDDRLLNPDLAGGALLDLGIYPLSIISMIMKAENPEKVTSLFNAATTGVDAEAVFQMHFAGGVMAHGSCSMQTQLDNLCRVMGSEGSLCLGPPFHGAKNLQLIRGDHEERWEFDFGPDENFRYQIDAVHDYLSRGLTESPKMQLDESIQLAVWMDAFRREWGIHYPFE